MFHSQCLSQGYQELLADERKIGGSPRLASLTKQDADLQHMLQKFNWINEVLHALSQPGGEDGWSAPKTKKSLSISSKIVDGIVAFRLEGIVKQKLFKLCSLLYE